MDRLRIRKLTSVMESVRPMKAWNRTCAARPDMMKSLQIKRYSQKNCEKGIVLVVEERLERILPRQRETQMGLTLTLWMWRLSTA